VGLSGSGHVPTARQTGKARGKRDLDDGAVEELLFGWFEGWNREGKKTKISSVNSILSFPFFLFSTNCRYLEILLIQSFLIKLIIYLDFTLAYFVQRLTTPLGPELCVKINTSLCSSNLCSRSIHFMRVHDRVIIHSS
jgi:hypothetical protein